MRGGLAPGQDGRERCWWGGSTPDYMAYHDGEWGRPVTDDRGLYERLTLEAFQSGLSWLTILRKREGFRAAFAGFEIERVARVRRARRRAADGGRRRSCETGSRSTAAITNARAARGDAWGGRVTGRAGVVVRARPRAAAADRRSPTCRPRPTGSKALAKELKRRGFAFVGPTTMYSTMQACGVVNDHLAGCFVRREVERLRR